jgi:scyllo-inositol 2-dehydrogenase (NADP+)
VSERANYMEKLRAVVVGLGRVAYSHHIPKIIKHDGFELVGLVEPLIERLDEARSEFSVKGYSDLESALIAEKPGLVVIASPTKFHCDQAIQAFENGCDVFCDKPFAMSLSQAQKMAVAMKKHGRKLMLYQPHRADLELVSLIDILRKNLIGEIYMIKRSCSGYTRRNDWQAFKEHGGGMLNNYGTHYIDQLLYLADSPVKHADCSLRTIASLGDADDVVKAVIETENGIILDLDINMAAAQELRPWEIFGRCGSMRFNQSEKAWEVKYFDPEELSDVEPQQGLAAAGRSYSNGETINWREEKVYLSDYQPIDYYQKCYEYFALDLASFVPIEQSLELMRVIGLCHKSAEARSI